MARNSHLQAVPDEFQFESETIDNDPYLKVVTREEHKFIHAGVDSKLNLKQHKFQTKASNEHDHSVAVNFRVPPDIASRFKYLAEHHAVPANTVSALWRDAGYWYLVFMERVLTDEDFSAEMKLAMKQAEVNHFESVTYQRTALVASQAEVIRKLIDVRDWSRLPAMITAGREVVAESTVDTGELERAIEDGERALERR